MRSTSRFSFLDLLTALVMLCTSGLTLAATPLTTTTSLVVSPSSTATSGTLLTLTATVADQNSSLVLRGSVTFYDGTKPLQTVQLVSTGSAGFTPGTATYKTLSLAVGNHSLTAKFTGTNTDTTSTSSADSFTVTGPARTVTALTSSTNPNGTYTLNATMTGVGSAAPTGNIVFTDTTAGSSLGTAGVTAVAADSTAVSTPLPNVCSTAVASGDFNGDGLNDLIVGAKDCSTGTIGALSILPGNGNGTFQTASAIQLPAGFIPGSITVADYNSDGILDLAVGNGSISSSVIVLLGNGNGTFQAAININSSETGSEASVSSGDFNGDGIPDLLITLPIDPLDGSAAFAILEIALGNGDGTFQTPVQAETQFTNSGITGLAAIAPRNFSAVVAADVNGDGKLDLEVLTAIGLYTYLGNEDGSTFQNDLTDFSTAWTQSALAVEDMNGDGIPDVIITSLPLSQGAGGQILYVGIGQGNGHFTYASYPEPSPFTTVAISDFNQDGNPDVAAANASGQLCVWFGTGGGVLSPSSQCTSVLLGAVASIPGNFRGFGVSDVAVAAIGAGEPVAGGINLVTGAIQSSTAALPDVTAAKGDQVIAIYQGDSEFNSSTSNSVTLGQQSFVNVSLTYSVASGPFISGPALGNDTTFTATLNVPGAGSPTATGSIQFYDGATALGSPVAISGIYYQDPGSREPYH